MLGATVGDLEQLANKRFVLVRDEGLILIKHWKMNNYIQNDRFVETKFIDDLKTLFFDENNSYTERQTKTPCIQNVSKSYTQDRLGKNSIIEEKENTNVFWKKKDNDNRFIKPTIEEIRDYCNERNNGIDAQKFYDFYESKGWLIGKNKMKDWKAAIRTWERKDKEENQKHTVTKSERRNLDAEDYM